MPTGAHPLNWDLNQAVTIFFYVQGIAKHFRNKNEGEAIRKKAKEAGLKAYKNAGKRGRQRSKKEKETKVDIASPVTSVICDEMRSKMSTGAPALKLVL